MNRANGAMVMWLLLLGTMYGSAGKITHELANGVSGGNSKMDHTPLLVNVVANVDRKVVMAGVGTVILKGPLARCRGRLGHGFLPSMCCPSEMG